MSLERNLIISILKLTREEPILIETINSDIRMPLATTTKLLKKLQNEGLIDLKNGSVEASSSGRLKLAVRAASQGGDLEGISNLLCWQEFEEISAYALKNYGYTVVNNVRFKNVARKWEIDIVGCRKPLVICIDCKHWQHAISHSALRRIVDSQVERTKAFADSLPNILLNFECTKWNEAKFIPTVLSLTPSSFKFYDKVPIVPVLQLQDFLNQLPVYTDSLRFFLRTFNKLDHNF